MEEKATIIHKACNEFITWRKNLNEPASINNYQKQKRKCLDLQKKYGLGNVTLLKIFGLEKRHRFYGKVTDLLA